MEEKEQITVVNPETGKKYLVTIGEVKGPWKAYKINLVDVDISLAIKQWPFLGPVRHISDYYKKNLNSK